MYKRVSTALQSRAVNRLLPVFLLGVLSALLWFNLSRLPSSEWFFSDIQWLAILPVCLLTSFNLFFETKKWLSLMREKELPLRHAFRSVLYGMCAGILTPNRIGEFVGRAAVLPKPMRKKGAAMTLAGAVIQGGVTLVFGICGLLVFPIFTRLNPFVQFESAFLPAIALAGAGLLILFAFRTHIKRQSRAFITPLKKLSTHQLLTASGFAVLRYVVFTSQFALALFACGFSGSLLVCYSGIFLLYFCQSYVPFTGFGELGVREVLAVFIFGSFMPNPVMALVASLLVWLANIGLPVLAGIILMKFSKIAVFGNR